VGRGSTLIDCQEHKSFLNDAKSERNSRFQKKGSRKDFKMISRSNQLVPHSVLQRGHLVFSRACVCVGGGGGGVCVCACACVRACVCVCVRVRERERECSSLYGFFLIFLKCIKTKVGSFSPGSWRNISSSLLVLLCIMF